jgi:hypothetical protein
MNQYRVYLMTDDKKYIELGVYSSKEITALLFCNRNLYHQTRIQAIRDNFQTKLFCKIVKLIIYKNEKIWRIKHLEHPKYFGNGDSFNLNYKG